MIGAVVLAAGLGTRMGMSKPLLSVGGRPALARVLSAVDEARVGAAVVVLGRDAEQIRSTVDLSGRIVVENPHPERGLSSSLTLGLDALPAEAMGALVLHADMPFVRPATVRAVCALAEQGAPIAAPLFRTTRGFPVYFSRPFLAPLRAELAGDIGGRRFLDAHRDLVQLVFVQDPGCARDLDRPDDLVASERRAAWTTSA
jgi:molybdenum cofactor cytidylyltransferase